MFLSRIYIRNVLIMMCCVKECLVNQSFVLLVKPTNITNVYSSVGDKGCDTTIFQKGPRHAVPLYYTPTLTHFSLSFSLSSLCLFYEDFAQALTPGAAELFSEFEEDNRSGALTLKNSVKIMIRQGVLKDDGGDGMISEPQMARIIAGVKAEIKATAAKAKKQRSRFMDSDEEEDNDDDLW